MRSKNITIKKHLSINDVKKLSGIHIARISTVPFFVVTQLKHQIELLGKHEANVTVITSDGPELALLDRLVGVRCEPINIPRAISPWLDLVALIRLIVFFKHQNIHISHSTTPKAGLLTALAAFLTGVPLRLHTFTGQPWVHMRGPKRWLARTSDKVIGVLNTRCYTDSISQREFLINEEVVDSDRLFVIGKGSLAGVDVQRFDSNRFSESQRTLTRQSLGLPCDALVLMFVGRITVDKGIRELLHAFQEIKSERSNVHLVLVGPIDSGSGVSGLNPLSNIEHIPRVHVVGFSDNPESYLSIADILCLPSYREGFGTVVIEAAAMGVPTIGSDIYGLSDAVVHGVTGLLVPPRNVEELTKALEILLVDKMLRKKMGEAAKQRALSIFDARIVNEQVAEEYRSLLQDEGILA